LDEYRGLEEVMNWPVGYLSDIANQSEVEVHTSDFWGMVFRLLFPTPRVEQCGIDRYSI
jgi:hypothetical protein